MNLIRKLISIKCLLFATFAVLMGLSGFLGYVFVSIQNEKSINDAAELCALSLVDGVSRLVQDRINIGHRLNLAESYYFLNQNLTLDNWYNVWYIWRPMTLQNMRPLIGLYSLSSLGWTPNYYLTVNLWLNSYYFGDFNGTVCNDTVNFPRSNCSVRWAEVYPMGPNPLTRDIDWDHPIAKDVIFMQNETSYWKAGPIPRTGPGWVSKPGGTPNERFSPGYAPVVPFLQTATPMLNLQINVCLLNARGECVGSMFRSLLLRFLGDHLTNLTSSHKLLLQNGRLFCYESVNKLLTGASHGSVYLGVGTPNIVRYNATESLDPIIAAAGKKLLADLSRPPTASAKEYFSVNGEQFICYGKPLRDEYGLSWMVAIVLSLTDLFKDISRAAKAQLIITIVSIILLSILGSALVSLALMYPLKFLKREMKSIANMDFDHIDVNRRSIFYEIANIQSLFSSMVRNLKLYKPFLPDAIIPTPPLSRRSSLNHLSENDPLAATSRRNSPNSPARISVLSGHKSSSIVPNSHAPSDPIPRRSSVTSTGRKIVVSSGNLDESPELGFRAASFTKRASLSGVPNTNPLMSSFSPTTASNSLTSRITSILLIDFRSFHRSMEENEEKTRGVHSDIIEFISKTVAEQRGMCSPAFGDKIMAFWNLRKFRLDHPLLCASSALMIHQFVHTMKLENPLFEFGVVLACTSGSCLFGSTGNQTIRNFAVFSESIQSAFLMQKVGRMFPVKVMCDADVYNFVKTSLKCRLIAVLPLKAMAEIEVFEIIERDNGNQDDTQWVHQDKENKNFTIAAQQIFRENHQTACSKHLRAHLEVHGDSDPLGRWLYQNYNELCQLTHPNYGFSIPLDLLCPVEQKD